MDLNAGSCRICLSQSNAMKPLTSKWNDSIEFLEMLISLVDLGNSYSPSQNICNLCELLLISSYCFKKMCLETETLLKSHIFANKASEKNTRDAENCKDDPLNIGRSANKIESAGQNASDTQVVTVVSKNYRSINRGCRTCNLKFKNINEYQKHRNHFHAIIVSCTVCGKMMKKRRLRVHMKIHKNKCPQYKANADSNKTDQQNNANLNDSTRDSMINSQIDNIEHVEVISSSEESIQKEFEQIIPSPEKSVHNEVEQVDDVEFYDVQNFIKFEATTYSVEESIYQNIEEDFSSLEKPIDNNIEPVDQNSLADPMLELISENSISVFRCRKCDEEFAGKNEYQKHRYKYHFKMVSCPICDQVVRKDILRKHMANHSKVKRKKSIVNCTICGKPVRRYLLEEHMATHNKVKTKEGRRGRECSKCEIKFMDKKEYENHRNQFHSIIVECEICEKSMKKGAIRFHMETHRNRKELIAPFEMTTTKPMSYNCPACNIKFKNRMEYQNHRYKFHSVIVVCFICGKTMAKKLMAKHLATHNWNKKEEEKRFICPTCGRHFKCEEYLKRHLRIHTGEKRYVCKYCDKSFLHWNSRRHHIWAEHTNQPKYECYGCDKTFVTPSILQAHIKRMHMDERKHECNICEYKFFRIGQLKTHMVVHTGEKNVFCEICNKAFGTRKTMQSHMKIHSGERNYVCVICKKTFTQIQNLRSHMKTHPDYPIPPRGTVLFQKETKKATEPSSDLTIDL